MMDRGRMSLMTFPLTLDILRGKMSVEDSFLLARSAGIGYVDIMSVSEKILPVYKDAVQKTGVQVYCYIATISFFQSREKIQQALWKELKKATALDAKLFMLVPVTVWDQIRMRRYPRGWIRKTMLSGFRLAVEMGKSFNIKICFETTPHDVSTLSGNSDCKYIIDKIPELGFVLDAANMLPHGDTTMDAYELLKDRIVHVHLKDVCLEDNKSRLPFGEYAKDGRRMHCCVWGQGVIPVMPLYTQMVADGYQGRFAIEYVHPEQSPCSLEQHKRQLERFFAE